MVKLLLAYGAAVNMHISTGDAPLGGSILQSDSDDAHEIAKVLIGSGATIDTTHDAAPSLLAVLGGRTGMINLLLETAMHEYLNSLKPSETLRNRD